MITINVHGMDAVQKLLTQINTKLDKLVMDITELTAALTSASDQLEKAKAEILAEIKKITDGGALTPEALAAVERLKGIAQSLDDVVPDVPPAEPEA